MSDHDRQADVRRVAKVLRDGMYSYNQSKDLFKKARQAVGLRPSTSSKKGSVDRLTTEEVDAFMDAAYEESGRRGLMMRLLLESGARAKAFTEIRAEHISYRDLEIRILGKGGKRRDVPILSSLARELRLHLGERESGHVFQSPRGGGYSKRRIQQIVKEVATAAGVTKRVYPHLMRHTIAQRLADEGMPENLLQQFLGHERAQTTQRYYRPRRRQVKDAHRRAMQNGRDRGES